MASVAEANNEHSPLSSELLQDFFSLLHTDLWCRTSHRQPLDRAGTESVGFGSRTDQLVWCFLIDCKIHPMSQASNSSTDAEQRSARKVVFSAKVTATLCGHFRLLPITLGTFWTENDAFLCPDHQVGLDFDHPIHCGCISLL